MAIPTGTTSRQVERIARYMQAGVLVLGMMAWWTPGFRAWGALIFGELAVLSLFLVARITAGDRTVPGHLSQVAWIVPAVILLVHVGHTAIGNRPSTPYAVDGAINVSLLVHICLIAAAMLLSSGLLSQASRHRALLTLCGGAMMAGAVLALALRPGEPGSAALAYMGFAGAAVWVAGLWGVEREDSVSDFSRRHGRWLRAVYVAFAAVVVVWLAWRAPREAVASAGGGGVALVLGGAFFARLRKWLLGLGGGILAAGALGAWWLGKSVPTAHLADFTVWGEGEAAFESISAQFGGLTVVGRTVGWVGLGWMALGLVGSMVVLRAQSRGLDRSQQARAVAWIAATAVTTAGMLAGGGMFIPSVTMAFAFVWGLLPPMLGRPVRSRWGILLLGPLVGLMLILALARKAGLVHWAATSLGAGDSALHAITGFVLALATGWYVGAKRWWLGLIAIAVAASAGGAAEIVQKLFSRRAAQWSDFYAHLAGVSVALVLYLLAMGARGCESDAAAEAKTLQDPSRYGV